MVAEPVVGFVERNPRAAAFDAAAAQHLLRRDEQRFDVESRAQPVGRWERGMMEHIFGSAQRHGRSKDERVWPHEGVRAEVGNSALRGRWSAKVLVL